MGDLAQPGQTLASLYDPDLLQIEGEVNDTYREPVKVGEARVSVPAVKWEADLPIAEIFPISAPGSRTFKVRTGMLQDPDLMPGMFARLELPLGHSRGLLIPQAAVPPWGSSPWCRWRWTGRPAAPGETGAADRRAGGGPGGVAGGGPDYPAGEIGFGSRRPFSLRRLKLAATS